MDIAGTLEHVREWTLKLEQWQNTVTHYKSQINAYKSQLAATTGVRDVQAFFTQAKSLTTDLKALKKNGVTMNDLLTNPGGQFNGELDALYSKYSMFDSCDAATTALSQDYASSCKKVVINKAVALQETTETQTKIDETVSDISALAGRIELAPDSKASQDMANAITTKSVQRSALTTQWEMSTKQSELRDQMLTAQRQKAFAAQQLHARSPTLMTDKRTPYDPDQNRTDRRRRFAQPCRLSRLRAGENAGVVHEPSRCAVKKIRTVSQQRDVYHRGLRAGGQSPTQPDGRPGSGEGHQSH